jgi:hypothetical protein
MAIAPSDRPLDTLRDEVVDKLIVSYGHGRLSLEAFQRRLDEAFETDGHDALIALVEDLELPVDNRLIEQKQAVRPRLQQDHDDDHDVESIIAVFGGSDRSGPWRVPAKLRVITVFGGSDIDLSQATFTSHTTRIDLLCLFGGVDIKVPEGLHTTMKAVTIFGGAGNKAPACTDSDAPRLVVDGLVMFGGADVKLKRTVKERALELANRFRTSLKGELR